MMQKPRLKTAKLCRGCSGLFCLPSTGKVFKIRVCKKTALLETPSDVPSKKETEQREWGNEIEIGTM